MPKKSRLSTPPERIVRIDYLLLAFNPDVVLKEGKRFADLECGHKAITKNIKTMVCPRCSEMLRRSFDGTEDWDAYRHHGAQDTMTWVDDPMRQFNEPTDLSGRFIRDPDISR